MIRALAYLRAVSILNRVRAFLGRLRSPKYIAGALFAAAYFYYFLVRPLFLGPGRVARSQVHTASMIGVALASMIAIRVGWVLVGWVVPSSKPALRFTPAEIDFLFPAPVSRRTLVHFSLVNAQLATFVSALILGAVWGARSESAAIIVRLVLGWWIFLSTVELHRSGINLTYARLRERGVDARRVQAAAAGALVLVAVAAVAALRASPWPSASDFSSGAAFGSYLGGIAGHGAFRLAALPVRMLAGPILAGSARGFLVALVPAALLLAAHYRWVLGMEVSFAEGSIALAEKRARILAAAQSGQPLALAPRKAGGDPFRLSPHGPVEIAFLWKNLVSISVVNWRTLLAGGLLVVQAIVVGTVIVTETKGGRIPVGAVVVTVCAIMLAFYAVLVGPQLLRQDLRQDLHNVDILKTYPIPGWRLVLGEMLAPLALLSVILWVLLSAATVALLSVRGPILGLDPGGRLAVAASLAAVAPAVCAVRLVACNAQALWFPGWVRNPGTRPQGIDVMGQRMLLGLADLLVILLSLFPAAVAAALAILATEWILGLAAALALGTAAVLVVLGAECAVGIWLVGERFGALDLSSELRP